MRKSLSIRSEFWWLLETIATRGKTLYNRSFHFINPFYLFIFIVEVWNSGGSLIVAKTLRLQIWNMYKKLYANCGVSLFYLSCNSATRIASIFVLFFVKYSYLTLSELVNEQRILLFQDNIWWAGYAKFFTDVYMFLPCNVNAFAASWISTRNKKMLVQCCYSGFLGSINIFEISSIEKTNDSRHRRRGRNKIAFSFVFGLFFHLFFLPIQCIQIISQNTMIFSHIHTHIHSLYNVNRFATWVVFVISVLFFL